MFLLIRKRLSAAEVLAGALQDHNRAIIIGEKSFGKGSVQEFVPLESGEVLSLTTAMYQTPLGRLIEGRGIMPDKIFSKKYYNNLQEEQGVEEFVMQSSKILSKK